MIIKSFNVLLRFSQNIHVTPEAKAMDQDPKLMDWHQSLLTDAGLHVLAPVDLLRYIFRGYIVHIGWLCHDNQKRPNINRTITWKYIVVFSRAANNRCQE